MERLDKVVSKSKGVSRSEARGLILRGLISVNGGVVRDIGAKVNFSVDEISLEGDDLSYKEHIYIVMNKPKGVLSASEDKRTNTVVDLLDDSAKRRNPFPVGRLDKNTTGMLILTDDGDFAHRLLSPKKKVPKEYIAVLDGEITSTVISGFEKGVTLADGTKLSPAKLTVLDSPFVAGVTIIEGKYHQIKRMFGVFGLGVNELSRVSFGGLKIPSDLKEGQWRELNKAELSKLLETAGLCTDK